MRTEEGIIQILVGAGVGVLAPNDIDPWPIYEGQFPSAADECLVVRNTGGRPPEVKVAINYPAIQVLVRSEPTGYVAASEKAKEVFVALHAIDSAPPDFPELTSCLGATEPNFVGYDEAKRPVWSVNFNCILSKDPEGYRDQ
jgi:hypothetical protein